MYRIFVFISLTVFSLSVMAQETGNKQRTRKKQSAGYASRDATVLSMMGWGVGIFAGIATLFALLDNNTEGEGSGGHCH